MTETSYFYDGLYVGDASLSPYDSVDFALIEKIKHLPDADNQGVIGGYQNNLIVTNAGGANVSINTGAAIVDGRIYENTAALTFVVSGAAVYWVIGLRESVSAQTVRAFARGNYASRALALASLVHTAGVTWEIPLAVVLTTGAGAVSAVYDDRFWVIRPAINSLFVPAMSGRNLTDATDIIRSDIRGVPLADNKICSAYGQVNIPVNFRNDFAIYTVIVPGASGNAYMSLSLYLGAVGAAYNTVSSSVGLAAYAVVNTIVYAAPYILGVSAEPNDVLSIIMSRDAVNALDTVGAICYVSGWLILYSPLF